jgi:hypothetical protein
MKRKISACPLGTRFKYTEDGSTFVLLNRFEFGLVAKWEGVDASVIMQGIYSLEDSPEGAKNLEVFIIE